MSVDTFEFAETVRDLKLASMYEGDTDANMGNAMELEFRLRQFRDSLSDGAADLLDEWLDWANECE